MFNVKRNGSTVEITEIPQTAPVSLFKEIADECLICYSRAKEDYEVVIRTSNDTAAGVVEWGGRSLCGKSKI